MTIDDVAHYSAEEKARIIASYAAHEREARTKGVPTLGSGRIFPVPEDAICIKQRDFPSHWPRIGGLDFGWDHPFAAVELVWDRDTDCVYVSRCHRASQMTPIIARGSTSPMGEGSAVGLTTRWSTRDAGRRRHPTCSTVSSTRARSAASTCTVRRWQRERRGRSDGHARSNANRVVQGIFTSE